MTKKEKEGDLLSIILKILIFQLKHLIVNDTDLMNVQNLNNYEINRYINNGVSIKFGPILSERTNSF